MVSRIMELGEEQEFICAIKTNPTDSIQRLVYADWLEERGDVWASRVSAWLRIDCELAEKRHLADPSLIREWEKLKPGKYNYHPWLYGVKSLALLKVSAHESKCPVCYRHAYYRRGMDLKIRDFVNFVGLLGSLQNEN